MVTVDYETVDGSAKAGEDYVAASGTLTFEVGETEKTVAVTVLDDAKDEGEETFRLRLSNAVGAYLLDHVAVGTIENADPLQQAWLARFGRTVGSQAIDAIGSRFEGGGGAAQVTIGGQALALDGAAAAGAEDGVETDHLRFSEAWRAAFGEKQEAEESRTMEGRELLLGSSFNLTAGGENGAPRYGAWGRFAVGSFDAELDGLSLSGEVTTGFLGADVDAGRWLAGAALSVSEGEGPFTLTGAQASNRKSGTIGSTLTSVWPYARLKAGERLDLWAMAGLGRGTMTVDEDGGAPIETDIGMSMGAVGAKGALVEPGPEGGIALGLRTDAMWVRTESDAVRSAERGNLEGATAEVTRLRVILDASRAFALEGGGTLTPALELGLRQDGGGRRDRDRGRARGADRLHGRGRRRRGRGARAPRPRGRGVRGVGRQRLGAHRPRGLRKGPLAHACARLGQRGEQRGAAVGRARCGRARAGRGVRGDEPAGCRARLWRPRPLGPRHGDALCGARARGRGAAHLAHRRALAAPPAIDP